MNRVPPPRRPTLGSLVINPSHDLTLRLVFYARILEFMCAVGLSTSLRHDKSFETAPRAQALFALGGCGALLPSLAPCQYAAAVFWAFENGFFSFFFLPNLRGVAIFRAQSDRMSRTTNKMATSMRRLACAADDAGGSANRKP